ncbi:MAG: hypothetical protein CR982_00475 [Candidatus Cloacimonadota bacterium]|nr:MAG: hypothetical protein CR982_00475 [Candidatus Cloacimonadota bacterium]PIE78860.1 MAG: hypothetical protein CSA15_05575 [Candidatus Delongbacteria bacterium]
MKKISFLMIIMICSLFGGTIDAERGVITATGIGIGNENTNNPAMKRMQAITMGKLYAIKDLIATVKGMYVSSETSIEDYMVKSDVIRSKTEGIARAFRVANIAYMDDGSIEVTVEMSLNGELSDLILKDAQFADDGNSSGTPVNTSYNTLPQVDGPYTGLVIDCSALSLRPALAPKVLDPEGREVYGSAFVSRNFAVEQGMVGYLKDISKAAGNPRVGDNPLVIKAIDITGTNSTDVIISENDAKKIKDLAEKINFLRECRVILIIR